MEPVKFDHKPEGIGPGPVKIKGLNLKSEVKEEVEKIVDAIKPEDWEGPTEEIELPITFQLEHLIKCVEEWPKDDNTIKAIGKLKGALQLLS